MCKGSKLSVWRRVTLGCAVFLAAQSSQAASPPQFREVLSDVLPAVVHIASPERVLQPHGYIGPYEFFFKTPVPQGVSSYPLGTGFLLSPKGTCVTSFRAIEGASRFEVITSDKRRWKAERVGGDRALDLAVLKIAAGDRLPHLNLGESEKLAMGDSLLTIAQPLGYGPLLSEHLLASKGYMLGRGALNRFLVLNQPTHAANAGAPLIDARGRVVGMALSPAEAPPTFGFALPSQWLGPAVRAMLSHGKVIRPWLGIVARELPSLDALTEVYAAGLRSGLIVDNLIVDGPAAKAGLEVGDLILAEGKTSLRNLAALQDLLGAQKVGDKLRLKIFRRKQGYLTLEIALAEIPSAEDLPENQDLL